MEIPFETIWQKLQTHLKPGTMIRNWTFLMGYPGDMMRVAEVEDIEIVIQAPKAKNLQRISYEEFERVWKIWPAYKNGRLQRQEMTDMTFHSKYIISILRWMEDQQL